MDSGICHIHVQCILHARIYMYIYILRMNIYIHVYLHYVLAYADTFVDCKQMRWLPHFLLGVSACAAGGRVRS